ncbi:MAG: hypothetical protein SFT91_00040, partial [Rickettsiaceae bacterium]|nr:hypothetical protein [Rickettsiaceae bacterium]
NITIASSNSKINSGQEQIESDLSYPNYQETQKNLPIKTNLNKVTNEFNSNIENIEDFNLDINQAIDQAKTSVTAPNISEMLSKEDLENFESERSRLSQIPEHSLESEGRSVRLKSENSYMNDFEVDYTKQGSTAHKNDIDAIVNTIESKMESLTSLLKENGIDCQGTIGSNELVLPFVQEEVLTQKSAKDYRQTPCEQKQNLYDCKDIVKLRCSSKSFKLPSSLNFTSNLPTSSNIAKGEITFGWPYNHSLSGGPGTLFDYNINFNIEELAEFAEFSLAEIGYDDFIRISINDHQIFNGPFGGDRLILHHHRIDFFSWFYRVQTSASDFHSSEQNTWFTSGSINLKSYLKQGPNKIDIRVIVGNKGGIWLKFIAKTNSCSKWEESWEEQCIHKK